MFDLARTSHEGITGVLPTTQLNRQHGLLLDFAKIKLIFLRLDLCGLVFLLEALHIENICCLLI